MGIMSWRCLRVWSLYPALLLSAVCLGGPTVRVALRDGAVIQAELVGLRQKKLTLRQGRKTTTVGLDQVREVRFARKSPDPAPRAKPSTPKPPTRRELERLAEEFLRQKPGQTLDFARDLSKEKDRATLKQLVELLGVELRSGRHGAFRASRYRHAYACLRAYVLPVDRLPELREEVQWVSRRARSQQRRRLMEEILGVIDQRIDAESKRSNRKGRRRDRNP